MGYNHARSHACLLTPVGSRKAKSPPRFFLRRAPKSLWLYVNQPGYALGAPLGFIGLRFVSSTVAKIGHAAAAYRMPACSSTDETQSIRTEVRLVARFRWFTSNMMMEGV